MVRFKAGKAPRRLSSLIVAAVLVATGLIGVHRLTATAASCVPPTTDYGTVSNLSVTISSTATYRVWTRMAAADSTNNTYMLELDGSTCYTIGGSTVPTYAAGATSYFSNDTTNWISKTSAGNQADVSLSAGTHTVKLIGNAPGVVVDRLVLTQDTSCVPTGTGDNCANPVVVTPPPTTYLNADVNQDGIVNIQDFGLLKAKFGQTSNLGRADINGDGVVNIQDFGLLKAKFGQSS